MTISTWIRGYARQAPVTAAIIAVCCAVALLTAVQALSLSNWARTGAGEALILWGPWAATEPAGALRALTAGFLHLDAGHLAINMLLLLLIGREVETFTGPRLYAALYLAGVLGSTAAVLLFDPQVPTAGASGALYALMVVLVGVIASRGGDLRAPLVLVGANVVYSFLVPGVSLFGHLGGVAAGALMVWPVTQTRRVRWAGVAAAGVLAVGCIAWRLRDLAAYGIAFP